LAVRKSGFEHIRWGDRRCRYGPQIDKAAEVRKCMEVGWEVP
jgi:hypothetical protein